MIYTYIVIYTYIYVVLTSTNFELYLNILGYLILSHCVSKPFISRSFSWSQHKAAQVRPAGFRTATAATDFLPSWLHMLKSEFRSDRTTV